VHRLSGIGTQDLFSLSRCRTGAAVRSAGTDPEEVSLYGWGQRGTEATAHTQSRFGLPTIDTRTPALYVAASMPRRFSQAEIDRFLGGRHVAVLGTNSANGAPVLTPIWYLYRDGRILMRTDKGSVKTRNIERDPRVTVCVQDERPPYASVTVYGKASLEPPDDKLAAAIARHYLGASPAPPTYALPSRPSNKARRSLS